MISECCTGREEDERGNRIHCLGRQICGVKVVGAKSTPAIDFSHQGINILVLFGDKR